MKETLLVLLLPFAGTSIGAACVYLMKSTPGKALEKMLNGFAAGVMLAASVWSLLLPAIEQSEAMGGLAFLPAAAGFWAGILFLLAFDEGISRLCSGRRSRKEQKKQTVLFTAVTLHNIPEGIAVGVVLAAWLTGSRLITFPEVLAVSAGIAIQNVPEGAIISMPLLSTRARRGGAFGWGVLSGAVEPLAALAALWISSLLSVLLPYLLSFAAGAMIYVAANELIPEMKDGAIRKAGLFAFTFGFTVMMALDVALG